MRFTIDSVPSSADYASSLNVHGILEHVRQRVMDDGRIHLQGGFVYLGCVPFPILDLLE